jgi:hypothetical protein
MTCSTLVLMASWLDLGVVGKLARPWLTHFIRISSLLALLPPYLPLALHLRKQPAWLQHAYEEQTGIIQELDRRLNANVRLPNIKRAAVGCSAIALGCELWRLKLGRMLSGNRSTWLE